MPKKKGKVEYEVTILPPTELTVYPEPLKPMKVIRVTYLYPGLAPGTVTISKEEYTEELMKKLIRKDIERRLKIKPRRLVV